MKNNNRLYYLLTAGTLTVLLFATYLLFGGNFLGAVADAATIGGGDVAVAGVAPGNGQIDNAQSLLAPQSGPAPEESLAALQAQNAKLIQMVQIMQERERQYQAQLQAATQALAAPQAAPAGHDYAESEHNEHEGAEHGEHEKVGEDD